MAFGRSTEVIAALSENGPFRAREVVRRGISSAWIGMNICLFTERLDRGVYGAVYPVNAFYMKNPGPAGKPAIARTAAYTELRAWLRHKTTPVVEDGGPSDSAAP